MAKAKIKGVGDTTSLTIPEKFSDVQTGKERPVTPEMLKAINEYLSRRDFVHLMMTALHNHVHGTKDDDRINQLELKVDRLLEVIERGKFVTEPALPNVSDDLDDMLENFT